MAVMTTDPALCTRHRSPLEWYPVIGGDVVAFICTHEGEQGDEPCRLSRDDVEARSEGLTVWCCEDGSAVTFERDEDLGPLALPL